MAMGILFVIFFALPILAIALIALIVYYAWRMSKYKSSRKGTVVRSDKKGA